MSIRLNAGINARALLEGLCRLNAGFKLQRNCKGKLPDKTQAFAFAFCRFCYSTDCRISPKHMRISSPHMRISSPDMHVQQTHVSPPNAQRLIPDGQQIDSKIITERSEAESDCNAMFLVSQDRSNRTVHEEQGRQRQIKKGTRVP